MLRGSRVEFPGWTPGTVKLLLPPRQSRGNSRWISEATIGNVGLTEGTAGFVDAVVMPTGGLAAMLLEDALNRFVLTKIEARTTSRCTLSVYRILLNSSRSLAGVLAGRFPWQQRLEARTQRDSRRFRADRNSPGKEIEGWQQMGLPLTFRSKYPKIPDPGPKALRPSVGFNFAVGFSHWLRNSWWRDSRSA